ncbi:MAG: hypothetical protein Q9190_006539 [Brigantiaea leucoxantha]
MSLFGQPDPPKSNPFASLTNPLSSTSQSQPQQSQAPTLSGLFASATSQPQQQPQPAASNPFQSLSTSQPQQLSTPFGAPKDNTTQPASGSSLFAPASTPAPGASIFASNPPQNQQNQPTQNGQQSTLPNRSSQPAYFESLLEKGKKRARNADGRPDFGELPGLQLGLDDIARRVREIGGAGAQTTGDRAADSKAHYLLAASGINPGTTRRDLNALNAQPAAAPSLQLPAEWDPDTSRYVDHLQQQSTLKMISEGIERAQQNFDTFLMENLDINWEAQRKKIYEHYGLISKDSGKSDSFSGITSPGEKGSFGRSTRRGRTINGERSAQSTLNRSLFGASGLQKSVIGTPGTGQKNASLFADVEDKTGPTVTPEDRFSRDKQSKFALKVQALNLARLQEKPYPILHEFKNVQSQPGGDSPHQLLDAYKALIEIVKEPLRVEQGQETSAPKERQFATDYLDENPNSAPQIAIQKRIVDGSRRSLEKQFFESVETLISRNAKEANIGGIPTAINKIRAYIRVRLIRKDLVPDGSTELQTLNDDYCWALIFFMLRCGMVSEAAEYVAQNGTSFRAIDRNFITYITSYAGSAERRLNRSQQDRISAEYQQRSRIAPENSLDPYRMACYKVIGRCELGKRNIEGVPQTSNDWLWLQYSLVRETNRVEEVAGDVFGLEELRDTVREIGQRHYGKGQEGLGGFGTYFHLLVLAGMFEQAVSFLYSYSYIAAVHFAIALDYYGLLRVSDFAVSDTELLTYNTKDLPQISFGRMVGYYTRDFRAGNLEAAVDYLTLICLNADLSGSLGKSQASLCHEALRELVLESREFAQLLGDIRSDGTRIKGSIEHRLRLIHLSDQAEFLKAVTIQAASVADDNGRITDAVLLYHLAEDYDNVIVIINRALSEAIATELGKPDPRLQPLKARSTETADSPLDPGSSFSLAAVQDPATLARNMISLYQAHALYFQKIRPAHRETCGVLLQLAAAKSRVADSQWAAALDIIASLNILPLNARGSIPLIRAAAQNSNSLPQPVGRNLGPLLLWTITCIGRQREVLASGGFEDATRKMMREELADAGRDLMTFAGLVRYRLEKKVWEAVTGVGGDCLDSEKETPGQAPTRRRRLAFLYAMSEATKETLLRCLAPGNAGSLAGRDVYEHEESRGTSLEQDVLRLVTEEKNNGIIRSGLKTGERLVFGGGRNSIIEMVVDHVGQVELPDDVAMRLPLCMYMSGLRHLSKTNWEQHRRRIEEKRRRLSDEMSEKKGRF